MNDGILQVIENPERFKGKTLTASAKIRSNCGRAAVRIFYISETTAGAQYVSYINNTKLDEWQVLTVSGVIPEDVTKFSAEIMVLNGDGTDSYVDAEWIKLEEGGTPTPYRIPNLAAELMKCQRYYQIRTTGDIDPVDLRPSMATITDIKQREDGNYEYIAELR